MKKINLKVNGMKCVGCENGIKSALKNLDGVENVEANHATCEVIITYNEEVNKELIEQFIMDLGYEVVKEK